MIIIECGKFGRMKLHRLTVLEVVALLFLLAFVALVIHLCDAVSLNRAIDGLVQAGSITW